MALAYSMTKTAFITLLGIAITGSPATSQQAGCGFSLSFSQADEGGNQTVRVFRSGPESALDGARPFAFIVPDVKVNTDGTRISYKADDPRGRNGAINDIRNAYRNYKRPVSDFEAIRDAGWQPTERVWQVLSPDIIEMDKRPGREGMPCMDDKGYLVSMTADVAKVGGFNRVGDCDQSKWIDALEIPAFVVPGASRFQKAGVKTRSLVIAMTTSAPNRIALGIVGDSGPRKEIGEASVEMNRILNGLPDGDIPSGRQDAKNRFQAGETVFLVVPGAENRAPRPITKASVSQFAGDRFEAWGGKQRLLSCLAELR